MRAPALHGTRTWHACTTWPLTRRGCRWRTALIIRELEQEVAALARGSALRRRLKELLRKKAALGELCNQLRAARSRRARAGGVSAEDAGVERELAALVALMSRLDEDIGPLIEQDGEHYSKRWGYLSITGATRFIA